MDKYDEMAGRVALAFEASVTPLKIIVADAIRTAVEAERDQWERMCRSAPEAYAHEIAELMSDRETGDD